MNVTADKGKVRRAFEVARELKLETPTVLDFLASRGHDVSRKQMQPVDEETYVELLRKFDQTRLRKYQSDHASEHDEEQKRDSVRLRQAEIEMLQAAKPPTAETTPASGERKISLPKPQALKVVEPAPASAPVIAPEPTIAPEPLATPAEVSTLEVIKAEIAEPVPVESIIETLAPTPPVVTTIAPEVVVKQEVKHHKTVIVEPQPPKAIHPTPAQPIVVEAPPEVPAAPAPLVRRKIELPKGQPLKIIEQAPKPVKRVEQPRPAQQSGRSQQQQQQPRQQGQQSQQGQQTRQGQQGQQQGQQQSRQGQQSRPQTGGSKPTAIKPSAPRSTEPLPPSLALSGALSGGQAGKKKLKRKKIATKVETPEDALETAVAAQIRRDNALKGIKLKPGTKPIESAVPASRSRRKKKGKGKGAEGAGAAPGGGRGPRKKPVDQQEVTASIKKTMAMMDGRGKGRQHHARGGSVAEEETGTEKLRLTEFLTTQEFANLLEVPVQDIIKRYIEMGMIISINQRLDRDTIEILASEFETEIEFVTDEEITPEVEESKPENFAPRQPIVTVMGHVDHGKTTLLDHLRRTRVAEKEYGGITQHIGAYEAIINNQRITFLDTPGHEAFTAMRARGAQLTDIVVLVVGADDRVMPQTLEAIDHARAAGVPIVVAVNKIDKPNADPDAIYKQLADANLLVERWGGKHQSAEISAKFGQGVDELLQEIVVAAEVLELKADPTVKARGVVIESRLDKGLGVVATILVQAGTLKIGDPFVVGQHYGRVRALYNEAGVEATETGPARPIQVIGFSGVPQAGDKLMVYPTEKEAREIALRRQQQQREISMRQIRALSLEQMSRKMKERELKDLPLVIKGDVHGSVEVLADALMKLATGEVKVNIIHRGVGAVTESDVLLASASGAIVIGFHVHPNPQARDLARQENVEIRSYRLIHEVVDDIRLAMEGLLAPTLEEKIVGQVEIRKVFRISRIGSIAGCYVLEGKVTRNSKVRLIRDGVELWSGELSTLKRFKDDAREVLSGFECGASLNGYNDINEGDRIEVYEVIEKSRKLEDSM